MIKMGVLFFFLNTETFKKWKEEKQISLWMVKIKVAASSPTTWWGRKRPPPRPTPPPPSPCHLLSLSENRHKKQRWEAKEGADEFEDESGRWDDRKLHLSLMSHWKTPALRHQLSPFPRSSVWAAGLSAPGVTANTTCQEQDAQESPMCFWRLSKKNRLFCVFLPFFPSQI